MLSRFSSAAHHLSPPAVTVHLDPAVCFADQAIFGNENYEIPFHDTFFLEFVPYLMAVSATSMKIGINHRTSA